MEHSTVNQYVQAQEKDFIKAKYKEVKKCEEWDNRPKTINRDFWKTQMY